MALERQQPSRPDGAPESAAGPASATWRTLTTDRTLWLLIGLALVLRTVLAYRNIERPGLQFDEVLFVNAATARQPGFFLFKEAAGVPLMVFPYIGALKSWLLAPVFSLFDVRPATIRLPGILMTSAALGVLYAAVRSLVDRRTALLVFGALLFDASVFWLTRDDVGPSAIEFACKCAALACAARVLATRRVSWTLALVAILALGTFNKLNFVWTVNGIAAVSAVLILRQGRGVLRGSWRRVTLAWVGAMAALYGIFGWYYLHFDIGSYNRVTHDGSLLSFTWPQFVRGTNAALSGTAFHDLAIGPMQPRTAVTLVLLALFALGTVLSVVPRATRSWPVTALAAITLIVAAQTLVTASATAPWHYVSPLPYGMVVAAYGVVAALRLAAGAHVRVLRTGLVTAMALVLLVDGGLLNRYERDLDDGQATTFWTPLIYDVNNVARREPGTIVTADWGIYNQVWALSPSVRGRLREEAFNIQGGGAASLASSLPAAAQPVSIVVHGEGHDAFPGNRQKLLDALPGRLHLVQSITAPDGTTMFEIYRFG